VEFGVTITSISSPSAAKNPFARPDRERGVDVEDVYE
jgi:hypothetical protein